MYGKSYDQLEELSDSEQSSLGPDDDDDAVSENQDHLVTTSAFVSPSPNAKKDPHKLRYGPGDSGSEMALPDRERELGNVEDGSVSKPVSVKQKTNTHGDSLPGQPENYEACDKVHSDTIGMDLGANCTRTNLVWPIYQDIQETIQNSWS